MVVCGMKAWSSRSYSGSGRMLYDWDGLNEGRLVSGGVVYRGFGVIEVIERRFLYPMTLDC